jgi:hypothetical protein
LAVLVIASLCVGRFSPASFVPPPLGKVKFNDVGLTERVAETGEVTVIATVVV